MGRISSPGMHLHKLKVVGGVAWQFPFRLLSLSEVTTSWCIGCFESVGKAPVNWCRHRGDLTSPWILSTSSLLIKGCGLCHMYEDTTYRASNIERKFWTKALISVYPRIRWISNALLEVMRIFSTYSKKKVSLQGLCFPLFCLRYD